MRDRQRAAIASSLSLRQHHQPGRLDPHRTFALEALQLLVDALARGAEQLRHVFLRQLQADADLVALLDAVAARQQQDLLGQARRQRPGVEVLDRSNSSRRRRQFRRSSASYSSTCCDSRSRKSALRTTSSVVGAVRVGIVRARHAVEQGDVAEPGARLDVGERDLLAGERDRAHPHRAEGARRTTPRPAPPRAESIAPSATAAPRARDRIASRRGWESLENHDPDSMFDCSSIVRTGGCMCSP